MAKYDYILTTGIFENQGILNGTAYYEWDTFVRQYSQLDEDVDQWYYDNQIA